MQSILQTRGTFFPENPFLIAESRLRITQTEREKSPTCELAFEKISLRKKSMESACQNFVPSISIEQIHHAARLPRDLGLRLLQIEFQIGVASAFRGDANVMLSSLTDPARLPD